MVLAMRVKAKLIGLVASALLLLTACEETVDLENIQDRTTISLEGTFETESPDDINYPVKVLFAIDMSLSMGESVEGQSAGSDPEFLRMDAVQAFVDEYNTNENASFEIMLWSNNVIACTEDSSGSCAFTKDPDEINRVLDLKANDTTTDYLGTLAEIQADIQSDINSTENTDNIARSKYIVIFLSDGIANTGYETQSDNDIWNAVEDIVEMTENYEVGSFALHTFLLDGFDDTTSGQSYRDQAITTLQGMANEGGGQYNLLESADSIDFINMVDVRLTTEYIVKYLVAYNFNTIPGTEIIYADSDADGLSNDDEEEFYGTDPLDYDTDDDGWGDYLEVSLSSPDSILDPLVFDSNCDVNTQLSDGSWPDTDGDGLNDCEEVLLGTSRYSIDYDNDGMPDVVEFLAGTNELDDDTGDDSDWDGREDWMEVQQHTNVNANDPLIYERYAYYYSIEDQGLVELDQGDDDISEMSYVRQYGYSVSNIDIVDTMIAGRYAETTDTGLQPGDNLIRFYIAQVPEDFPDTDPIFRVAEFYVNVDDDEDQQDFDSVTFELLE